MTINSQDREYIRTEIINIVNDTVDMSEINYSLKEIYKTMAETKEHIARVEPYLNTANGIGFIMKITAMIGAFIAGIIVIKKYILFK